MGQRYPSAAGWLFARVWNAGAFGTPLQHLLTHDECAAFLAAAPQAGRIMRPLLHMLARDPVPEVVCRVRVPRVKVVVVPALVGVNLGGCGGGGGGFSIFRGIGGRVFLRPIYYDIVTIIGIL